MTQQIIQRMRLMAERVSKSSRPQMRKAIETLLESGGTTYDAICSLAGDASADTQLRSTACWVLARLGEKRASSVLIAIMNEDNVALQGQAALSLGMLKSKRAIPPLITT